MYILGCTLDENIHTVTHTAILLRIIRDHYLSFWGSNLHKIINTESNLMYNTSKIFQFIINYFLSFLPWFWIWLVINMI